MWPIQNPNSGGHTEKMLQLDLSLHRHGLLFPKAGTYIVGDDSESFGSVRMDASFVSVCSEWHLIVIKYCLPSGHQQVAVLSTVRIPARSTSSIRQWKPVRKKGYLSYANSPDKRSMVPCTMFGRNEFIRVKVRFRDRMPTWAIDTVMHDAYPSTRSSLV